MRLSLIIFLCLSITNGFCQTGTYIMNGPGKASCKIAVTNNGRQIECEIFAWWATASGRSGDLLASGMLDGNTSVVKSAGDNQCTVKLVFAGQTLSATFNDCMNSNLPEDFSGSYKLMSTRVPGIYVVSASKAYFHQFARTSAKMKSFLIKGDHVDISLNDIVSGGWVRATYLNTAGKTTSGFLKWSDLKSL